MLNIKHNSQNADFTDNIKKQPVSLHGYRVHKNHAKYLQENRHPTLL